MKQKEIKNLEDISIYLSEKYEDENEYYQKAKKVFDYFQERASIYQPKEIHITKACKLATQDTIKNLKRIIK